jgi:formylglycine-generating enzyme required for sulfatase activity
MHTLEEIYQKLLALEQRLEVIERQTATQVPTGMVLIPAGVFAMGATTNAGHESYDDEKPQHTVHVSAFYLDRYEVTKAQWDDVYNWATKHGYQWYDNHGLGKAPDHPVHTVDWFDCVKWCNARSEKEGLTPCYTLNGEVYRAGYPDPILCDWLANGYRLPTEAEWEKAARGGAAYRRFPWSDSCKIQHTRANYYSEEWYAYDTSPTRGYHPDYDEGATPYTSPVGSFPANGYGLYDMAGNVWEWCWDWYSAEYYSTTPDTDPTGPATGSDRVLRGSSWHDRALEARNAYRFRYDPFDDLDMFGFRCARRQ